MIGPRRVLNLTALCLLVSGGQASHCFGSNAVAQIACENYELSVCCPKGASIDIQSANYGRTVPYKDMCRHSSGTGSTTCGVTDPKDITECNGNRSCKVSATLDTDPCENILKYLNVTFSCKPNTSGGTRDYEYFPMDTIDQANMASGQYALIEGIEGKALQIWNPPYEEHSTDSRPVCVDRIDEFAIGFTMDTFLRFSAYGGVLHKPLVCVDSRRSPRHGSNLESYNLHINENQQLVFQIQMMKRVYNYATAKTLLQGQWHHIFVKLGIHDITNSHKHISFHTEIYVNGEIAEVIKTGPKLMKKGIVLSEGVCAIDEWRVWFEPKSANFIKDQIKSLSKCGSVAGFCKNNGNCIWENGGPRCKCQARYYGNQCQFSTFCLHGGLDGISGVDTNDHGFCKHGDRIFEPSPVYYIGCFDLTETSLETTNHKDCENTCSSKGFTHMAKQQWDTCMCVNDSFSKELRLPDSFCDKYRGGFAVFSIRDYVRSYHMRIGYCVMGGTTKANISLRECSRRCSKKGSCHAFQFSHQTSDCTLLDGSCRQPLKNVYSSYLYEKGYKIYKDNKWTKSKDCGNGVIVETISSTNSRKCKRLCEDATTCKWATYFESVCSLYENDLTTCRKISTVQPIGIKCNLYKLANESMVISKDASWKCMEGYTMNCTEVTDSCQRIMCHCVPPIETTSTIMNEETTAESTSISGTTFEETTPSTTTEIITDSISTSVRTEPTTSATVILTQAEQMMALFGVKEADLTVKSLTLGGSSAMIMLIVPLSLLVLSDLVTFKRHFRYMRRNLRDFLDAIRKYSRSMRVYPAMKLDDLRYEDIELWEANMRHRYRK